MTGSIRGLVVALVTTLTGGGCVYTSQVSERPLEPPRRFASASSTQKTPDVGKFWLAFGDTTLNRLVDRALKNNLELRSAVTRIDQAAAGLKLATAGWYPGVSVNGRAGRSQRALSSTGLSRASGPELSETDLKQMEQVSKPLADYFRSLSSGAGGSSDTYAANTFELSLGVQYEIDLWGKVRYGRDAARATVAAAVEDLKAMRISVVAQLVDAYFVAVELRAQLALTDETVRIRRDHLSVVKRRYSEGVVTALDMYQAQESLARVQSQRPVIEGRLRLTEHAIALLVGGFPANQIAGSLDSLPDPIAHTPVGVPADLLLRRPDIRAAHARLVAADAQVGQSVAKHYPSLSISASIGANFDPLALIWSILGNLTAPLFTGFAVEAEVNTRKAALAGALVAYKATLLRAVKEVEDALVNGQAVAKRLELLEQRVEAASGTLRMSTEQYLQGLVPYLVVLNAEQSVFAARSELISARRELISARVQLARAVAGDWTGAKTKGQSDAG